ncbi:AraC family transcriptional regulator [Cerasicoccus maritimus]|uniref:AraC family transcriptional regulator n=1 Tax=Cerasicoccus maritimus TaxID=490089 RepID=UPI0028527B94|nr:AraC family transcriptional regulator [Cerasicoccus maritimus]
MSFLQDIEIDVVHVGRADWPSGIETYSPWHTTRVLKHHELWFFWRGNGWIEAEGERYEVRQGQLYWFRPGVEYSVTQSPERPLGTNFISFDIQREGEYVAEPPPDCSPHIDVVEADLAETVTRHIVELYWQCYVDYKDAPNGEDLRSNPYFLFANDHYQYLIFAPNPISIFRPTVKSVQASILTADTLFRGFLMEVLTQSQRSLKDNTASHDRYQRRLISQIAMRIQQEPGAKITTAELATECGYSADYFTRVFKKIMHCSPQRYQVYARINKACLLLRDSDLLIKQIALQLGYCNEYFFSRQFKEVIGRSPSDYRKK